MSSIDLIRKYNIPGPRYTSYPTVPYWDTIAPALSDWKNTIRKAFERYHEEEGLSIYVHLPYCESLCTYCGCNTRITVNHGVEEPYIEALLAEWNLWIELFGRRPKIKEIHLGGGTPTFFKPDNLRRLIEGLLERGEIAEGYEFGFEGHPNNTTAEHLATLYELGFRRLSLGIQDFDPIVQDTINRIQSVEHVERCVDIARYLGYESINFDLIYGLPKQQLKGVVHTINEVTRLRPDRIAFYSYAHVPWIKPGQRKFTEADLPDDMEKRALYETGREMLEEAGYMEIGMDHFALPSDELYHAFNEKRLHRNFMGYTSCDTHLLVGLGASSISDSWFGFAQNYKKVEDYITKVNEGVLPIFRGHLLSEEDLRIRQAILDIMCRFETNLADTDLSPEDLGDIMVRLEEMEIDGLMEFEEEGLKITERGKAFVRNVCMAFDLRLWRNEPKMQVFSKVI
jgi:oxygen-independent coproporphyrinogen-3 oxidase